jgi:hypothetical protein
MEIVTKFECLLSNAEVMAMIRENHDKLEAGTATGRPEEVSPLYFDNCFMWKVSKCVQATEMEDRIHEYLSGLPSKLVETGHIETLFKKLRGFTPTEGQPGFKPTELLNIANLRPTSLV